MKIETKFNIGDDVCPFCQGTGRCKSLDLNRLPEGSMSLKDAMDKFGEETECVDGCFVRVTDTQNQGRTNRIPDFN